MLRLLKLLNLLCIGANGAKCNAKKQVPGNKEALADAAGHDNIVSEQATGITCWAHFLVAQILRHAENIQHSHRAVWQAVPGNTALDTALLGLGSGLPGVFVAAAATAVGGSTLLLQSNAQNSVECE